MSKILSAIVENTEMQVREIAGDFYDEKIDETFDELLKNLDAFIEYKVSTHVVTELRDLQKLAMDGLGEYAIIGQIENRIKTLGKQNG